MKASELRKKNKEELGDLLVDLSRERFNLKMQKEQVNCQSLIK